MCGAREICHFIIIRDFRKKVNRAQKTLTFYLHLFCISTLKPKVSPSFFCKRVDFVFCGGYNEFKRMTACFRKIPTPSENDQKGTAMMLLKRKNIDATTGPILKSIIIYAIPLILSTLIQTLFHSVDLIVLRYVADSTAIASVGATGSIITLIVNTFVGLSGGTNIILARFIGAKDHKNVHDTVSTSIMMSFFIGILSGVAGFFLAEPMLRLTNCPPDCFDGALIYLQIYFLSSPAILVYNFGSSIIRTSGDTNRPLNYMLLSGLLNLVLNIIFCFVLPRKTAAVAIATLASQVLGAVLVLLRLFRMDGDCKLVPKEMRFNTHLFGRILRFGLPVCLNSALFPLANLQIQSAINSFGSAATAGNAAAAGLETIVSSTTTAFGTSALTFVGQNLGAGKRKRVHQSFFTCLSFSTCFGLIFGILCYVFGDFLLSFYVGNDLEAIEYGLVRMQYIMLFYFIAGMNNVFGANLQAFGYSMFASLNSVFSVFVFRLIWMNTVYLWFPTYRCIFLCFFISWLLMVVCNITMTLIVFAKYKHNRLHEIT